jgi:hypothetical protein
MARARRGEFQNINLNSFFDFVNKSEQGLMIDIYTWH